MVSYPAKGINKFTFVNLAVALQQPDGGIVSLAALLSTGSRTATARLLCSTRSGVTCHPYSRCRRQRSFDPRRYRTVTRRNRPRIGLPPDPHPLIDRIRLTSGSQSAAQNAVNRIAIRARIGSGKAANRGTHRSANPGCFGQTIGVYSAVRSRPRYLIVLIAPRPSVWKYEVNPPRSIAKGWSIRSLCV